MGKGSTKSDRSSHASGSRASDRTFDRTAKSESRLYLFRNFIRIYWKSIFTFLWPITLFPLIFGHHIPEEHTKKYRCLYVSSLMMGYWLTECIPIFMTSLLPLFMMPALSLLTSQETTVCYFTSTTMHFLGCIFIGLAMKSSGLHIRIAMTILTKMGVHPRRIHVVICIITMAMTLFVSNEIVTALMCPIIHGILKIFEHNGVCEVYYEMTDEERKDPDKTPNPRHISAAYHLGIAYAANIGGLISVIGSDSVKSYHRDLETIYKREHILRFHKWFLFSLPIGIFTGAFAIFWLQFLFMGRLRKKSNDYQFYQELKERRTELYLRIINNYTQTSILTWHQGAVTVVIAIASVFWIFEKPYFIPGFVDLYPPEYRSYMNLSAPTMFAVVLLFIIPSNIQYFKGEDVNEADLEPNHHVKPLITWKYLQTKTKWGLSFVIGSSFTLAIAFEECEVFDWVYESILQLDKRHKHGIVLLVLFLTSVTTEIFNNVALTQIVTFLSLEDLSLRLNCHPIYLGNAIVMGSSHSFMLPTGSPPNAMMMAYGYIRTHHFLAAGTPIKIFAYLLTCIFLPTYGRLFWTIDKLPEWASSQRNFYNLTSTQIRAYHFHYF